MKLIDVDIRSYTCKNEFRTRRREVFEITHLGPSHAAPQGWGPPTHSSWVCLPDVRKSLYQVREEHSLPYRLLLSSMDGRMLERRNQVWTVETGCPTADEVLGFKDKGEGTCS